MKVIFLNLNYGRNDFSGILKFIKENIDIDIFCFQEIKNEIKIEIENLLKDFNSINISKELEDSTSFNLETFVNKKYENFKFEILENNNLHTAPAIFLEIDSGNSKWNILNFHGSHLPANKLDSEDRLSASQRIIEYLKKKTGRKIIGGDFNLLPNTESIIIFEQNGYKNLIKDFNIQTTRNENAWKLYPNNKQLYADYVFVSKDVEVKNFTVISNEISDHLPMLLEF